jgi:hypothetical protein
VRLELEGARMVAMVVGWKWIDRRMESVTYLSETRALREISIALTLPDRIRPAIYTGPIRGAQAESHTQTESRVQAEPHAQAGLLAQGEEAAEEAPPGRSRVSAPPRRVSPTAPHTTTAALVQPVESHPPAQEFYYVPLTLIDKGKMTRFDFTDERGAALPLLGSEEKGVMAAGLLVALAERALEEVDKKLPPSIARELRAIAEHRQKRATEMLESFVRGSEDQAVEGQGAEGRKAEGQGVEDRKIDEEQKAYEVLRGESRNARVLRALLVAFAHCYLMVVPLPRGLHRRRLIKFSYEENITFNVAPPLEGDALSRARQWAVRFATELTRTVGWKARQIWLGAPAFGHGGTYHLEMSAPPGVKITQLTLVGLTVTPTMDASRITWTSAQQIGISAPLEEQDRPHVFCREKQPGAFAVAYTKLRVTSPTVLRAAFCSAVGTALALVVGYHFLEHLLTEGGELTGAGAALLLAVPTAASIYISRVEEHSMVTNMLLGVRVMSLLSGASAFGAASVLILGRYVEAGDSWLGEAEIAWRICCAAAVLAAVVLGGAYFATWKEDQRLGPRWKRYRARWAAPPMYPPPPLEQEPAQD